MPTMAAMPWVMVPGNTTVLVKAAGRMRSGMGMKQKGVLPAIISSTGMPMVPRAMTLL